MLVVSTVWGDLARRRLEIQIDAFAPSNTEHHGKFRREKSVAAKRKESQKGFDAKRRSVNHK
jgi:hypothetical protein